MPQPKTGWMDTKIRPLCMLPTRDPLQNKGHILTESEGLEKDISCKWRPKESKSSNTPRRILIKLTKIKHKQQMLKPVREKQQIAFKGIPSKGNS